MKGPCAECKDTGYIVYDCEDGTSLSAYCSCEAGDAVWHRDEELANDRHEGRSSEDDQ